jgi:hypothetical protein
MKVFSVCLYKRSFFVFPMSFLFSYFSYMFIYIYTYTHTKSPTPIVPFPYPVSPERRAVEKVRKGKWYSYPLWKDNPEKLLTFLLCAWVRVQANLFPIAFSVRKALGSWQEWNYCYNISENPDYLQLFLGNGWKIMFYRYYDTRENPNYLLSLLDKGEEWR